MTVERTACTEASRKVGAEIKLNKVHLALRKRTLTGRFATLIVLWMGRRLKYALLAFLLLNFTIAGVSNAAAYLDPGTGSIIFQSIIAALATGAAVLASAWKSVAGFFGRLFRGGTGKDADRN
jgi:hypothetical protein